LPAITRQLVQEFFHGSARRGAPLDRDMRWGYFFTHVSIEPLEELRPVLESSGYRYVDILRAPECFFLHVEKVELHSSASLWQRCVELYALAEQHSLDSFDGFDVGNTDGSVLYR
jgi:hypothetical protein